MDWWNSLRQIKLEVKFKAVAGAAPGLQTIGGLARKFGVQTPYVNVHGTFANLEVDAPHQIDQANPSKEFATMRDQKPSRSYLRG